MKTKTCLTAGVILAGLGASGSALAETMEEALVSAYNGNTTLQAQRASLRATDEQVPQALSNWRPSVSLSGSAGKSDTYSSGRSTITSTDVGASDNSTPRSASLNISQPLYRGGRTTAQTEQAEAAVQAARAQLASTEQTVLLNVATAYMNVVRDQAVVDLNRNNEQVLQRQLDATNDRFRVGEVTRTDVSQAESRLSAAHADLIQAEGNLRASTANYVSVVGHAPEKVKDPGKVDNLPVNSDEARNQALINNPSILGARWIYEAANHGIDLVAGELLPSVSLNASASRAAETGGTESYSRGVTAGVNVTVPLYQQGQEYSRLRQQKHVTGQRQLELDSAKRDTIEATTRAWEALQTARARIVSYTDQIRAAEVALEGVRRESQVGSRTVLDVLNAEQELLNARVSLVQAHHDETVAAYQVRNAVGALTAQSLSLPVELRSGQALRGRP